MIRRRRRFQKPKVEKREFPVLIECFGSRKDAVTVHQGSETYEFRRDGRGRLVSAVAIEDHIACFLARPEMYRVAA